MGVVLFNHTDVLFKVLQGDRIAQLIVEPIATPAVREVESLPETRRGEGGFGSTGVSSISDEDRAHAQQVVDRIRAALRQ